MNLNHLCMSCMEIKHTSEICPKCGYSETNEYINLNQLPTRTLLNNRYLIGRVLGSGGFGITYLAWDTILNIKLAIKEYFPRSIVTRNTNEINISMCLLESKEDFNFGKKKFLDEARIIAKFNEYQNIVSVIDFFEENETAYIVMNYIDGITLKEYVKQRGDKISFSEAIDLMLPIMDALTEVHKTGILHRDISPDNIYITQSGQPKLLDFGTARAALGAQSTGLSVILKYGYAPIEQHYRNGNQGPWTDVYLVGATLYKIITGVTPQESLERIEEDKLKSFSFYSINIPKNIEDILMKALSVKISDRYQSVQELKDALLNVHSYNGLRLQTTLLMSLDKKLDNSSSAINTEIKQHSKKKDRNLVLFISLITLIVVLSSICYLAFKRKNSGLFRNTNHSNFMSDSYKPFDSNAEYKINKEMTMGSKKYSKGYQIKAITDGSFVVSINTYGKIGNLSGLIGLDDTGNSNDAIVEFCGDSKSLKIFNLKKGTLPVNLDLDMQSISRLDIKVNTKGSVIDLANLIVSEPNYKGDKKQKNNKQYMSDIYKPYYSTADYRTNEVMTMTSRQYFKGFKVNPSSETPCYFNFNLEGKINTLCGFIGLDDSRNHNSSIVEFYGDDKSLGIYNLRAGWWPQKLNLNVKGVVQLKIKITGRDVTIDFANLLINQENLEYPNDGGYLENSNGKYASDLLKPYYSAIDIAYDKPMKIGNSQYYKGYQMQLLSQKAYYLSFNLNGKIRKLTGLIGLDNASNKNNVIVEFYANDKSLATYNIKEGNLPQNLDLNVKGVYGLTVKITGQNALIDFANLMIEQ